MKKVVVKRIEIIIIILLVLSNLFTLYKLCYGNYETNFINVGLVNGKLNLKSSYGDTQAYHPKVLSFPSKWNRYKYWMSFTPYPYADSSKENPHVVVSDDMINWKH